MCNKGPRTYLPWSRSKVRFIIVFNFTAFRNTPVALDLFQPAVMSPICNVIVVPITSCYLCVCRFFFSDAHTPWFPVILVGLSIR